VLIADFSRILAGPYATMSLADLGARVIKIERVGIGDDTRAWQPPRSATGSTYFDSVNRNKESLTLDLSDDGDRRLAFELARRADVVVENFKPGTMQRYGLGYDDLRVENPGLVYGSITGFGSGAGAEYLGYDFLVQAVGGLMSISGEPDGPPTKVGVALVDVLTGKDLEIGILAALYERQLTGNGARFEVNLLSSLQAALVNQVQALLGADVVPTRMGNAHPSIAPYQLLECADRPLAVACGNDAQFAALARVLGLDALVTDPRFATNGARVANRVALVEALEGALAADTADAWSRRLTKARVPAGPVATIEQGIRFATSLGLDPTVELHDSDGRVVGRQIRQPITWMPAFTPRTTAPPALGEHSEALRFWLTH
jgi:crotonobetainyl-CoA:carnitine CoA-transferase CaiB-like acyl-CoA transferase